ncbi:MAG: hypothetical protein AAF399_25950 [Bacteroidota bacterium]
MPDFSTWLKQLWLQDAVSLPISGADSEEGKLAWNQREAGLSFLPSWSQQSLPLRSRLGSYAASPLSMLLALRSLEQLGLPAPLSETSLLAPDVQPFLAWLTQSVWHLRNTTLWVHRELPALPILQEHLAQSLLVSGLNFEASQSLPLVWASLFGSQLLEVPMEQLFPQLNGWMWLTERNHLRIPMEAETSLRPDPHSAFHPRPGRTIQTQFHRLLGQGMSWEIDQLQGMWVDLSWKDCWLGLWKWPLGPEQVFEAEQLLDVLEGSPAPVEVVLPAMGMDGDSAQLHVNGQPAAQWFDPENTIWKPLLGQQVWLQGWKQINQLTLQSSKRRKGHVLRPEAELLLDQPFGYALMHRPTGLCLHTGNLTRSQWST